MIKLFFKLACNLSCFTYPITKRAMRSIGIVLIVVGIAMLIVRGFSVQTEEKVIDVGPLEVTKKENKWIGWPVYAGGIAIVAGLIMVIADRRK